MVENVLMTIMVDIEAMNANVEVIVDLHNRHVHFGRMISTSCKSFRTRPLVRCQRCELCPEELRVSSASFKRCIRCSNELDCDIYYCSQYARQLTLFSRVRSHPTAGNARK